MENRIKEGRQGWVSLVMWVAVVVAATVATLAISSTYQRKSSNVSMFRAMNERTATARSSSLLAKGWQVYKVTSSISNGTYSDMSDFLNDYIAYTSVVNLGCSTEKVASSLYSPFELHFVDSGIFNDLASRSIEDWAEFASDLSVDEYNAFFHNKVQLFVDDLQPHYNVFNADGVDTIKRISTSTQTGSDITEDDIAHIGIWLPNAITMLELVGPSSSLDSDSLAEFASWSDAECPESHVLQESLDTYLDAYTKASASISVPQSNWESTTGLPTPIGVQVSIPTSSISSMKSTIELVTSMNGASVTYNEYSTTSGEQCLVAGFTVGSIYVSYVENNALDGLTTLSIKNWESDIASCNDQFVNTEDTMDSWNRYLDSHIGMYAEGEDKCEEYYDYIEENIEENSGDFQYALRVATSFGIGTHYYTGTKGVRSWEFNANDCAMSNETDICGCSNINSRVSYLAETGKTECKA